MLRILLATIMLLLSVSLAQAANCAIGVGDLDFGQVDAIGDTETISSADISIECDDITPGTQAIVICANIGAGSGGTAGSVRQSRSVDGALDFVLYTTSGNTVPWGSLSTPELGAPRRIEVPVSGDTVSATAHLYGVVPGGQADAPVGEYQSDFVSSDAVFTYAEDELACEAPVGGVDVETPFAAIASVAANCMIETQDLDFGTTGLIGDNIDAQTDFELTCTDGVDYTIAISGGNANDPENRLLTSGSDTVRYDLYSDPARTALWGTAAQDRVSGDGDGTTQIYDVYGRIPPQPAAAGAYTDTVVVTISY